MIATWQRDACEETYYDMERRIYGMVNSFRRKFNLEQDEAESAARLGFVEAYDTYDPDLVESFDKWVSTKVWSHLFASLRGSKRIKRRSADQNVDLDSLEASENGFDLKDFVQSLSGDARFVVVTVFNPPKGVLRTVKRFGEDTEINLRMAVKQMLVEMKWSLNRIRKAFREVRNAL